MRKHLTILASLLALILALGMTMQAKADETTGSYRVRVFPGNVGHLTSGQEIDEFEIPYTVAEDGTVKYGSFSYRPQDDAEADNTERYYVKGMRESGRDNNEALSATAINEVDHDID